MPQSETNAYEELARQSLEEGQHYAAAVAKLAGRREVVSAEDIYATDGTRLVAQGAPIGGGLRERLVESRLLKPMDLNLLVANGVTSESLALEAANLIRNDPSLNHLALHSGDPLAMCHGLVRVALPPRLAFKLTVAKEERPPLFRHLLTVAVICHYLALRLGLSEQDTANLLTAALFHDLGELHTDPALLDPGHRIGDDERRYVYVHPITGYLIARSVPGLSPSVPVAVLEHQERLDGSGYPHGLRAERISGLARIIGVADVCASILARSRDEERLSILMRLNGQKYDPRLLGFLQEGFPHKPAAAARAEIAAMPRLLAVAMLLQHFGQLRASFLEGGGRSPPREVEFLFERMVGLRSMLLQFGFDPDSPEVLVDLARADPLVAAELVAVLDEVGWQFSDLAHEIDRRQAAITAALTAEENSRLDAWVGELHAYLKSL